MRKSIVTLAVAGVVAVGGTALAGPALAESVAPSASSTTAASGADGPDGTGTGAAAGRPSPREHVTDALAGLVTDGTITQDQSDAVADALAAALPEGRPGGPGGPGGAGFGPREVEAAAADALGVSEDDLRTGLRSGKSVADVAEEEGVDLTTVTTAVTDAAKTSIAQAVTDGRITQERADALTADLADRVARELAEVHDGQHGPGGGRGGPLGGAQPPAPDASAGASGSAGSSSAAPTS